MGDAAFRVERCGRRGHYRERHSHRTCRLSLTLIDLFGPDG